VADSKQEALWVLRAQCDDREALELLLRHTQPWLHRYLTSLVGAAVADDVLQEVLMIVVRKIAWLNTPELFRPWLYRIASRAAFRHLRKEKRWPEQFPSESLHETASTAMPPLETPPDLLDLDRLPPSCRAVMILHFREELTLPEAAAVLEIPLGTVKSRLAYGLNVLRKRLGQTRSH
jgi:RNA polymerase sigma-70 factor (ECF subfamily)